MSEYINILHDGMKTGSLLLLLLMAFLLVFIITDEFQRGEIVEFLKVFVAAISISAAVLILMTFVGVIVNMIVQFLPLVI